jgi:transcription initiation factor TFIIIB Brf1 subunit/transcription initiation factor TFIIB
MDNCKHINTVTDFHEGTLICLDCSFVVENQIFVFNESEPIEVNKDTTDNHDYKEILNRLNCSYDILQSNVVNNVTDLYNKVNKTNAVSLKEFCAVTGLNSKTIVKNNKDVVCKQDLNTLLEKYCKLFNLTYKNYTVIKENISTKPHSGHPPLTVIGYHIYVYLKVEAKQKITIKEICKTLGISSISIQRYKKYELSLRS